jgi:hypothetical protein
MGTLRDRRGRWVKLLEEKKPKKAPKSEAQRKEAPKPVPQADMKGSKPEPPKPVDLTRRRLVFEAQMASVGRSCRIRSAAQTLAAEQEGLAAKLASRMWNFRALATFFGGAAVSTLWTIASRGDGFGTSLACLTILGTFAGYRIGRAASRLHRVRAEAGVRASAAYLGLADEAERTREVDCAAFKRKAEVDRAGLPVTVQLLEDARLSLEVMDEVAALDTRLTPELTLGLRQGLTLRLRSTDPAAAKLNPATGPAPSRSTDLHTPRRFEEPEAASTQVPEGDELDVEADEAPEERRRG